MAYIDETNFALNFTCKHLRNFEPN